MGHHDLVTHGPGAVGKLPTGIPGFEFVAGGGLPKGRTTLVTGTAGSAKTTFITQFLAEGIRQWGEKGVFVTFEEPAETLRANYGSMGWEITHWEEAGQWAFVDASPYEDGAVIETGTYDLGGLLTRLEYAIHKVGAQRVAIDSVSALFTQLTNPGLVRGELIRINAALQRLGVTAVLSAERIQEGGELTRYGVEEFVADSVLVLRHPLEAGERQRTIEVLKMRGSPHQHGEYPFTVRPDVGLVIVPTAALDLEQAASRERTTSGVEELDTMCGGGLFRNSLVLVSGATGCGKTLLATQFLATGVWEGERCLLLAFEESHDQLTRNAASWGLDLEELEGTGQLKIRVAYPETDNLEGHLIQIKSLIDSFQPHRVVVDSLTAIERITTYRSFQRFAVALTAYFKSARVTALLTATLLGGESATESQLSTLADTIILMRYMETSGEIGRGLAVLKMRGSKQETRVRALTISDEGLNVGAPIHHPTGVLGR